MSLRAAIVAAPSSLETTAVIPGPSRFQKKLTEAKYYERWKAEFGTPAWTALEKYANKLG